jgi:4-amino-4-deoxy-L-arabinose transferase-like glycosyltransferase
VRIGPEVGYRAGAVLLACAALAAQLALSSSRQSQTGDEGCHLFAGYRYWTRADFGLNPEHPPLLKLVAAIPLLGRPLALPPEAEGSSKTDCFFGAADFLYKNDADRLLFRARMAASAFTLLLAACVFLAADRFFGLGAAAIALALFAVEPSILAHGALVTTDMAVTCGIFAATYTFARYAEHPSILRLLACGLAAGCALVSKHSGILVLPILAALAGGEILLDREVGWRKRALRLIAALLAIGLMCWALMWAVYGFRFHARPGPRRMSPSLTEFAPRDSWQGAMILAAARRRLLPESYLYGLADVAIIATSSAGRPMFLLGTVHPSGRWFYFPVTFAIKSTLPLLALLAATPLVRLRARRAWLYLAIPPAVFLGVLSTTSNLNIGIRHMLPLYPFLMALAAGTAWKLGQRSRVAAAVVAALLLLHVASSARAFPNYLPYSNEAWGGVDGTYKVLTDSNVDWGQGLKAAKRYIDAHRITECWFAYFPRVVIDPAYYGIPCRSLPSFFMKVTVPAKLAGIPFDAVPRVIHGPVLIGATELSGALWGPGEMNPYEAFRRMRPSALIAGSILVFDGTFDATALAAESHAVRAIQRVGVERVDEALDEAARAVDLGPRSAINRLWLGQLLAEQRRFPQACGQYRAALSLAQAIAPEFQRATLWSLQAAMRAVPSGPCWRAGRGPVGTSRPQASRIIDRRCES